MKCFSLFFLLVSCITNAFVQAPSQPIVPTSSSIGKPPIDSTAINNWPFPDRAALSNDGAWFSYMIFNQPPESATLVIQDMKGLWKRAVVLKNGASPVFFSGNSKQAIFKNNDTLHIVTLGTNRPEYTAAISTYTTPSPFNEKVEWLAYRPKDQPKALVLRNLFTSSEQRFDSISTYAFGNKGNILLLQTQNKQEKSLQWLNLRDGKLSTIWPSSQADIGAYSLDEEGTQVAFIVKTQKDSQVLNRIWYYHTAMDKAIQKVDEHSVGLDPGLEISDAAPFFNAKGQYILFKLKQPQSLPADRRLPSSDQVKVTIWSYKDKALQPPEVAQNTSANSSPAEFTAAASITDSRITRLEREGEHIFYFEGNRPGKFVVAYKMNIQRTEELDHWREEPITYSLISLQDGTHKLIAEGGMGIFGYLQNILFSPKEDYLVYYDLKQQHYFSYNTLSGETRNISKAIPARLTKESNGYKGLCPEEPVGIAGWMADSSLLIYDNYDIWQVDLSGNKPPVNITRGYGQKHHIQFRIAFEKGLFNYILPGNASLLLTATSEDSKYMGVYRLAMGTRKEPEMLTMGPWRIDIVRKVANTGNYIVRRESPTQAPNYFLTNNFKDYHPLTDIQPQQAFNWMQAELINFKQLDGTPSQGILYKPEDFDPHKKYPLIINYYETHADEVFNYQAPGFTGADLNIPWFVSRGYLIFRPDIHYQVGEPGSSAYNSVMGGVQYLSRMPWVDTARMGLHGHSFGAYETNYIITHSHLFAAASEAAGFINLISWYGTLAQDASTTTGAAFAERGMFRMGSALWERPDLYIKNSPVFKIDQVTTPLLMMHNRKDENVPWFHGLEQFTDLRRLNKKVWMLQYDEGNHVVSGKEAVDYTTRLTQFFDHYLKGALPPKWMMEGSSEMKDKATTFDLDSSGIQP